MFQAAIGQFEGVDARSVASAVTRQCTAQLGNRQPQAGILFSAGHFDQEAALDEIIHAFPGIELVGCSTGGEMSSAFGFSMESMCLMLFASDTVRFSTGVGHDVSSNPEKAVADAVESASLGLDESPALALFFPDMAHKGIERIISEANKILGPDCPVYGGLAARSSFGATIPCQFYKNEVHTDAISIMLLSGPVAIASTVCNSWNPIGAQFKVTEADANTVRQIGCSSALDFYRKAYGPYSVPLLEMPLMIYDDDGNFTVRAPHGYDEDDGSIFFSAPIAEDRRVQLTEATPNAIIKNISDNVQSLTDSLDDSWSPQAAIMLSCTSRRLILGLRTKEEMEITASHLPKGLPSIGFYTYGELATASKTELHNCTLVVLLLGEKGNTLAPQATPAHSDQLEDSKALLSRKFKRSEEGRARLEQQREFFSNIMRKTNDDLLKANEIIEKQHQILKESLTLAQEVQQNLLPHESPIVAGYDIAGFSIYCDETGGDYIDYLPDDNGVGVVVGDACGHGIASALLMASTRAFLRMRVFMGGSPAQFLTDINKEISVDTARTGQFVTMQYVYLDSNTKKATWARAGHEPVLLYSAVKESFIELRGEGMALGIFENFSYDEYTTPAMQSGDILVFSTDGIAEARDHNNEFFGRKRLQNIILNNAARPAKDILHQCRKELQTFRGGRSREDDETLVIIKVE